MRPLILSAMAAAGNVLPADTQISPVTEPPKTPDGLAPCVSPMVPGAPWSPRRGEKLTYSAELFGISLGRLEVETVAGGSAGHTARLEYRASADASALVRTLFGLEFTISAWRPSTGAAPVSTQLHYRYLFRHADERNEFSADARQVISWRESEDKGNSLERGFASPVHDLLSSLFFLRSLEPGTSGCTILYGNQCAYTVWIEPETIDSEETIWGKRAVERLSIRYGSDAFDFTRKASITITVGAERIPLRGEIENSVHPVVELVAFEPGS